ncbi:MAG: radical SAM protein [Pirellulales bacterium]
MQSRDYTFLGTTQSLCPECLQVVPAKIIVRGRRVYFRKSCPEHGVREDFVCSDVAFYDRMEYSVPARVPEQFGMEPQKGCPLDCGLCTEHEQHTCIGIVELTASCNLSCPMCYSVSGPGGVHATVDECQRAIDRLVAVEGRPEILQLSGGEPTVHPQFEQIFDYAIAQPIDYVMINTNGVRLARDPRLVEHLARQRGRVEIYLQFDGLNDDVYRALRGEPLLDVKKAALDALGRAGLNATLVATLQGGVNDDQMGPIVEFGISQPQVTGVSFQPATYSGRCVLPEQLERRITFPDVIRGVAEQTGGKFQVEDFLPLPCAHPNCHSLAMAYRSGGQVLPLTRFIDGKANLDLLANGISFTRARSQELIQHYLNRQACCGGDCGPLGAATSATSASSPASPLVQLELGELDFPPPGLDAAANGAASGGLGGEFFRRVLAQDLGARDLFRITITSFLDLYNFDVRRVMKCCTHHVLPSGHVIPFCAYNVLYRNGAVPLPQLTESAVAAERR